MDAELEKLYSDTGRPSIAPERLLRATLLMVLYSIRSERLIEGAVSQRLLESVLVEAREHDLLSEEHFAVDGTLIQAWATRSCATPTMRMCMFAAVARASE